MMRKTIKGKLTMSVICIVAVSIILTTVGIVVVSGRNLIRNQTEALQLNADKYAEEINTWIENEKQLAEGAANSIEAAGNTDAKFIQSVMDTYAEGREELLNLYCGTKDSQFIQSNREAEIPEGYDPVERGQVSAGIREKRSNCNGSLLGCADQPDVYDDCRTSLHRKRTGGSDWSGCDIGNRDGFDRKY